MRINLLFVGVATSVLQIDNKIKIAIDPVLSPIGSKLHFKNFDSTRVKKPIFSKDVFDEIDFWLITHSHADHLDELGKKMILSDTPVVCDKKTASSILLDKNTNVLEWHQEFIFTKESYSIKITAIPAYHGNSFLTRKIVGKVNGYLVEVSHAFEKKTLYFTGDTVYHNDILKKLPIEIDVLIANLGNVRSEIKGGPLTMNIPMLNLFVTHLQPKQVIPIHIDDFSHYEMSEQEVRNSGFEIVPRGVWYPIN